MKKLFLYLFYESCRFLAIVINKLFYPNTTFINRHNLKIDKPTIIVSNHPNTLLDPIFAVFRINKQVFFLANSDLFKSKFGNWFFNTFYCIPVQRKTDKVKVDNAVSFQKAINHLGSGKHLYIAPEGGSYPDRKIRTLKSGTARIALQTMRAYDYDLPLQILPIGLIYESANYFQSRLIVNAGNPIPLSNYTVLDKEDNFKTVRKITKDLTEVMQSLIAHTEDKTNETLYSHVDTLLYNETPKEPISNFYKVKNFLENAASSIQTQVLDYFNQIEHINTSDKAVQSPSINFFDIVKLILGFPFFIYGLINNALPAFVPILVTNKINPYFGYRATFKILMGVILFPLFYWIQTKIAGIWLTESWMRWAYWLSLLPTGLIAWKYWKLLQLIGQKRRLKKHRAALIQQRTNILSEVNKEALTAS